MTEQEQEQRLEAFVAFQADREARGTLVALQRLPPTSTATKLKKRDGALVLLRVGDDLYVARNAVNEIANLALPSALANLHGRLLVTNS